jgi:pimeloyl-ACP methyl ester carboxylesterase
MDPEDEARMYLMHPNPVWDRLPDVGCPVLVAGGKVVEPTPSAWTERIAARLPRARVEHYDDLGHMGPMEAPERIAAAAQRFYDRVDDERRAALGCGVR